MDEMQLRFNINNKVVPVRHVPPDSCRTYSLYEMDIQDCPKGLSSKLAAMGMRITKTYENRDETHFCLIDSLYEFHGKDACAPDDLYVIVKPDALTIEFTPRVYNDLTEDERHGYANFILDYLRQQSESRVGKHPFEDNQQ